ncbi:MAG: hypothetical protein RLZ61_698, partial [Planctomycetota bacterium]
GEEVSHLHKNPELLSPLKKKAALENPPASTAITSEEVLRSLKDFYRKTARPDGSF